MIWVRVKLRAGLSLRVRGSDGVRVILRVQIRVADMVGIWGTIGRELAPGLLVGMGQGLRTHSHSHSSQSCTSRVRISLTLMPSTDSSLLDSASLCRPLLPSFVPLLAYLCTPFDLRTHTHLACRPIHPRCLRRSGRRRLTAGTRRRRV